jgi:hypothetical protein
MNSLAAESDHNRSMPHLAYAFIYGAINVPVGDIFSLLCAPVQELQELSGNRSRSSEGGNCCGGTAATLTSSSAPIDLPKSCSTADLTPGGNSLALWIETFCMASMSSV